MKKSYSRIVGLFFITLLPYAYANACDKIHYGDALLRFQHEVDSFDYCEVRGNLTLSRAPLNDPDVDEIINVWGLNSLMRITGSLTLESYGLESLEGLENLEYLGVNGNGSLIIIGTRLLHLQQLSNLKGKLEFVIIAANRFLKNVDGLTGIESVHNLSINDNRRLVNVDGVRHIAIEDTLLFPTLRVTDNPQLTEGCGLKDVINSGDTGRMVIENNGPATGSITEILNHCQDCTRIYEGDLTLASQTAIDGFNYCEVTGALTIDDSADRRRAEIDNLAPLAGLERAGSLYIIKNPLLQSLNGINITQVGDPTTSTGILEVSDNRALADISALSKLSGNLSELIIADNKVLPSLTGLERVNRVSFLEIVENPALTELNPIGRIALDKDDLNAYVFIAFNNGLINGCGAMSAIDSLNADPARIVVYDNGPTSSDIVDIGRQCGECSTLYIGDKTFDDNIDLLNFDYCGVSGTLTLENTSLPFGGFGKLRQVNGLRLLNDDAPAINMVYERFYGITRIGTGGLVVRNVEAPDLLTRLTHIDADMNIRSWSTDGEFSLPELVEVNGDITLRAVSAHRGVSFPRLTSVGDITLRSVFVNQREKPNLIRMPVLEEINNLTMAITDLTSLEGFGRLRRIHGDLFLQTTYLDTLNGLQNLTALGGSLRLNNNFELVNIGALGGLTAVPGSLIIDSQRKLETLVGLGNITSVGGDLTFIENPSIEQACDITALLSSGGIAGLTTVANNGPTSGAVADIVNSCQ